jgi:CO/xanthine dehydrogenase FAD-binding subunit
LEIDGRRLRSVASRDRIINAVIALVDEDQGIPGAEAIAAAAAHAGEEMDILGDIHASEGYRRAMTKVYVKRALSSAVARAR